MRLTWLMQGCQNCSLEPMRHLFFCSAISVGDLRLQVYAAAARVVFHPLSTVSLSPPLLFMRLETCLLL